MLEHLNETRNENLITIEDPIEFIFEPKKCIISREKFDMILDHFLML